MSSRCKLYYIDDRCKEFTHGRWMSLNILQLGGDVSIQHDYGPKEFPSFRLTADGARPWTIGASWT